MGWIRRDGDQWQLTAKGEFEGGCYRESNRFGRYIVWPQSVLEHRALVQTRNQYLSATVIGREVNLSASQVNRLLVERGWLKAEGRGWRVTDRGKLIGALQREDDRTGVPYVVWAPELMHHSAWLRVLERIRAPQPDIPSVITATLDGHHCATPACAAICNWLYLAGVVHAVDVFLPIEEPCRCDFFLPGLQLFIDDCSEEADAAVLAQRIRRQQVCEENGLDLLRVDSEAAADIDQWLGRELRKRGLNI